MPVRIIRQNITKIRFDAYEKQDGTQIPVEIGRTAGIANGVKIHFSDAVGEFK